LRQGKLKKGKRGRKEGKTREDRRVEKGEVSDWREKVTRKGEA
jgi:hypothetical protein